MRKAQEKKKTTLNKLQLRPKVQQKRKEYSL